MTDKAEEKAELEADPLHEMREQYKIASEYWADDRKAALEDIKFRAGEQWPQAALDARKNRPVLVVDKCSQYVRQVVNDSRQNRPGIKVRPVDSGADMKTAEIFQGLCRHIESRSNADVAYDTSIEHAATSGTGFIRVLTEYMHNDTMDQEIAVKRVRNPLNVLIDPNSTEPDGSDMKFCFVIEDVPCDDFEKLYPDEDEESFTSEGMPDGWGGDTIRVVEHWYIEEEQRTLHKLQDGSIVDDKLLSKAKEAGFDPVIIESREIPKQKVMWAKANGKKYIKEPIEWPGKWIPIIPVFGNEIDIEGKVSHFGLIRPAKDAMRLYNYSRSAFAERVALTPKAPWVAAEGQVEDYKNEWQTANTENHSVLRYTPVDIAGHPVPPPMRQSAADVPMGFAQDMQLSEHDIQASMGMYAASLGAPSNERSGKAIMARQREGDVGTFHYHDNLNRSIRHVGRIIVNLAPKIYDTKRLVRIIGEDGTVDQAVIDPSLQMSNMQVGIKTFYNLSVGNYDVEVDTGPSYTTKRQESAEAMMEIVRANPALMQIMGDLLVKNMDWPGAEDMSNRLKLMLPPQIQQAEQQKKGIDPQVQQIMQQAQQAIGQKDQMLQQAMQKLQELQQEILGFKNDHGSKVVELHLKEKEVDVKAYDAETKRMQVLQPSFDTNQIKELVNQTIIDLMTPNDMNTETTETMPMMNEQIGVQQ